MKCFQLRGHMNDNDHSHCGTKWMGRGNFAPIRETGISPSATREFHLSCLYVTWKNEYSP